MRPALSVIFFTVVSGSGYGLLFLLGLGLTFVPGRIGRDEALLVLGAGMALAAAGLISSMFHLGQPQRAWRALTQWRSSWLSREGVAALCSYVPALALATCLLDGANASTVRILAAALSALAVITVYCTSGIYTSLKTIHAWRNSYVLPGYLLFALLAGTAWFWLLHALAGNSQDPTLRHGLPVVVVLSALACWLLKRAYWQFIDTTSHPASAESATGLGRLGSVRSVEAPHTEENYLTHEMGFVIARKHAQRLRAICLVLCGPLPVALAMVALLTATSWPALEPVIASLVVISVTAAAFVERWLFFAQAKHVVMLYYHAPARA